MMLDNRKYPLHCRVPWVRKLAKLKLSLSLKLAAHSFDFNHSKCIVKVYFPPYSS